MSTRALLNVGFLKPHSVPGDRNHYFRVEDDVWGGFLAGEREYLRRIATTLAHGLDLVGEEPSGPRTRLLNAQLYMTWLAGHHLRLLAEWQQHRDENDAARRDDA